MDYKRIHPWRVNTRQAYKIQEELSKRIALSKNTFAIRSVAGVDVHFRDDWAKSAVCVLSFPDLSVIETQTAFLKLTFPYIPGLLTFREGPAILKAFKKIKNKPDVTLFDGQGICHPRRMGIAAHLGILLDVPAIGCAKSFLYGFYTPPAKQKGSYSYIYDKITGEVIGMALRTRTDVKPLFVSCGYKVDLDKSKELILELCSKFRIPQPLRLAHNLCQYT